MDTAIGLIETKGLVGLVEATDAMAKAANVKIVKRVSIGGAFEKCIGQFIWEIQEEGSRQGRDLAQSSDRLNTWNDRNVDPRFPHFSHVVKVLFVVKKHLSDHITCTLIYLFLEVF